MIRYFFDVVSLSKSQYDFHGRELATLEGAFLLAQKLSIECGAFHEETSTGCTISVRDASGKHYFSVPVRQPEPMKVPVADERTLGHAP